MALPNKIDQEMSTADVAGRDPGSTQPPALLRDADRGQSVPISQTTTPATKDGSGTVGNVTEIGLEQSGGDYRATPLFAESEISDCRARWNSIQTAFVDEPRQAVKDADNLVASLTKKVADGFASERDRLEKQWEGGENVSTEDLRLALQRYRSFFDRLLRA
jgi:hypothetical protein